MLRAAFVPEGQQPPPEFSSVFDPLHFSATLDLATGMITCAMKGAGFDGDIRAEWHPDEQQGSDDGEEAAGQGGGDPAEQQSPEAAANAKFHDGLQNAPIPPTQAARQSRPPPWPGYGGDAAKRAASFGMLAQAASPTATDAGATGGDGTAVPGGSGPAGQSATSAADTPAPPEPGAPHLYAYAGNGSINNASPSELPSQGNLNGGGSSKHLISNGSGTTSRYPGSYQAAQLVVPGVGLPPPPPVVGGPVDDPSLAAARQLTQGWHAISEAVSDAIGNIFNASDPAPTGSLPLGTRRIDRWGISRGDIHDIKEEFLATRIQQAGLV